MSYCWYCSYSIVFVWQLTFHCLFWCVEFKWFIDWFPIVDTLSIWCIHRMSLCSSSVTRRDQSMQVTGGHVFLIAWYTAHSKSYRRKPHTFWDFNGDLFFFFLCQAKDETLKRKSEAPEDIGPGVVNSMVSGQTQDLPKTVDRYLDILRIYIYTLFYVCIYTYIIVYVFM